MVRHRHPGKYISRKPKSSGKILKIKPIHKKTSPRGPNKKTIFKTRVKNALQNMNYRQIKNDFNPMRENKKDPYFNSPDISKYSNAELVDIAMRYGLDDDSTNRDYEVLKNAVDDIKYKLDSNEKLSEDDKDFLRWNIKRMMFKKRKK